MRKNLSTINYKVAFNNKMKTEFSRNIILNLVAALVFLFFGLLTYYLSNSKIVFFDLLRLNGGNTSNVFVNSYLADILFSTSIFFYSNFLFQIRIPAGYVYSILFLPIIYEFFQLLCINLGVFDFYDVLILSIPLIFISCSRLKNTQNT